MTFLMPRPRVDANTWFCGFGRRPQCGSSHSLYAFPHSAPLLEPYDSLLVNVSALDCGVVKMKRICGWSISPSELSSPAVFDFLPLTHKNRRFTLWICVLNCSIPEQSAELFLIARNHFDSCFSLMSPRLTDEQKPLTNVSVCTTRIYISSTGRVVLDTRQRCLQIETFASL